MERDSFVFYRSFYEAIRDLPRDIQGEVYTAIMEYSLNGITTENLKPVARSIFILIKPQIDANLQRFENGCKGGAPKGNQNARKKQPKNNQELTEKQPNDNVNDNDLKEKPSNEGKKKNAAAEAATLERKKEFYKSLVQFTNQYQKQMLRDFFDYWSEMNKSKTKMRFELEKTWEVSRRLKTWSSRDFIKTNKDGEQKDNNVTV